MNVQDVRIMFDLGVSFHPNDPEVAGQGNSLVDLPDCTQLKACCNGATLGSSSLSTSDYICDLTQVTLTLRA